MDNQRQKTDEAPTVEQWCKRVSNAEDTPITYKPFFIGDSKVTFHNGKTTPFYKNEVLQ